MEVTTVKMLKASEGMALAKEGRYCRSVLLKEGDDGAGWTEIPMEEAKAAMEAQIAAKRAEREARRNERREA